MGKVETFVEIVNQLEHANNPTKNIRNEKVTIPVLELIKEASSYTSKFTIDQIIRTQTPTSSHILKFLNIIVECFDHKNADVRILAEQEFDVIVKRLILSRNTEFSIRLVVKYLQGNVSARGIVILLARLEYILQIMCTPSRLQSSKFAVLSDTICYSLLKIIQMQEAIVHKAIENHFGAIFSKIDPDTKIVLEVYNMSLRLLMLAKGSAPRALSVVIETICIYHGEYVEKTYDKTLEHVIARFKAREKPAIGALIVMKCLIRLLDFENSDDFVKQTIEILLLLIANASNDVVFLAFSVLDELLKCLPKNFDDFEPESYLSGKQKEDSCSDVQEKELNIEVEEDTSDIIDPLLNSTKYEEITNKIESTPSNRVLTLPNIRTMVSEEVFGLHVYIASFLSKAFLLTGFNGTVKNEAESSDSLKILAFQCINSVSENQKEMNFNIKFDKRTQCFLEIAMYCSHTDEALAAKAFYFISTQYADSTCQYFDKLLQPIISRPRQQILKKRVLLDCFSNDKIWNIYKSKIFPQMIHIARGFCKSDNSTDQAAGTHFLTYIPLVFNENNYVHDNYIEIQNDFLSVFCRNELIKGSPYFERIIRFCGLENKKQIDFPPTFQGLVLNSYEKLSVFTKKDDESKVLLADCLHDALRDMLADSHIALMSNYIQTYQVLNQNVANSLMLQVPVMEILSWFNSYEMKKHVFISCTKLLIKTAHETWSKSIELEGRYSNENAYELSLLGLRCLNMVYVIINEQKPDRKTIENVDSIVVKTQNIFLPAKPTEDGPSFPRQANIGFDHCFSAQSLYSDIKGAYHNFRGSLNGKTDKKFLEFVEAGTSILCTALEYLSFETFNFFDDIVMYLKKLIDIAPVSALKIMHQLVKMLFGRNLRAVVKKSWEKLSADREYFTKMTLTELCEALKSGSKFSQRFIERCMGWLGPALAATKPEPNEEMLNSLSELEDLITVMFKVYRCRGPEEKKHVIFVMIELLRAGILHDMADPTHVIYNDVTKSLSDPAKCTEPELFEVMITFLVTYIRVQSVKSNQLSDAAETLLRSIPSLKPINVPNVVNAVTLVLLELIHQKRSIGGIIKSLDNSSEVCFQHAPNETLFMWFVILSNVDHNELEAHSEKFLTQFLFWLRKNGNQPVPLKSLLFPLMKLSEAVSHYSTTVLEIVELEQTSLTTISALLCYVISKYPKSILVESLEAVDNDKTNWLLRNISRISDAAYDGKDEFMEHLITILPQYNKKKFDQLNSSGFWQNTRRKAKSISEESDDFCIPETSNHLANIKITDNRDIILPEFEFNSCLLQLCQSQNTISYATRIIITMDVEQIWNIGRQIDKSSESQSFWKSLIIEFRQMIYSLEVHAAPEMKEYTVKLQELVDGAILFAENTDDFETLCKILANCEDVKIELSGISLILVNRLLKFVSSNINAMKTKDYLLKSVFVVLHDQHVIKKTSKSPLKTVVSHLTLLGSIDKFDPLRKKYLEMLFSGFDVVVDGDATAQNIDLVNQFGSLRELLCEVFVRTQQSLDEDLVNFDVMKKVRNVLLRHPVLHSMFMIGLPAVELGWKPQINIKGDGTVFASLAKVHHMCDYDVLLDFQQRQAQVGWLTRAQFEDMCVTLLGVLSTTPTGKELSEMAVEIVLERITCSSLAVDIFTSILLRSLKFPYNGDPQSKFVLKHKEKNGAVLKEMNEYMILKNLCNIGNKHQSIGLCGNFHNNQLTSQYVFGQISVFSIWTICGVMSTENDKPTQTFSSSSSFQKVRPSLSQHLLDTTSDLDTVSNVRSLLGIFSHWFSHGIDQLPIPLLSSVIRALQYLSDFFDDLATYDFLYKNMKIVYNGGFARGQEEEGMVIGLLLKAVAVLGIENIESSMNMVDKQKMVLSWVETGLTNSFALHKLQTLSGIIYLLQSCSLDLLKNVFDLVSSFLVDNRYSLKIDIGNVHELGDFATTTALRIIKEPFESRFKEALLQELGSVIKRTKNAKRLQQTTDAIENLIVDSISFADFFMHVAHDIVLNDEKDADRLLCAFRIVMACVLKCSSSGDKSAMDKVAYARRDLCEIYYTLSEMKNQNAFVIRTLPVLLLTLDGVERTLIKLFESLHGSEVNEQKINATLYLLHEIFGQIRNRKVWGRQLRNSHDKIGKVLMKIKDKDLYIYLILKLSMSQNVGHYARVPLLLPINREQSQEISVNHPLIKMFEKISQDS